MMPAPASDRTRRPRRLTAALLGLVTASLALVSAAPGGTLAASSPAAVVEETTSGVIDVLANKGLSSEQKRRRVEEIVYAHVDFDTLCRLVLARNWGRFSAAQQAEFVAEFKRHLSLVYGHRVESYKNERVAILGSREEAQGDWTVKTKILRGGPDDILMDYRLRGKDGQWRIIDVIIEGVSLVSNFRSQFQDVMTSGGPERVLQVLREKNSKSEPLKS